MVERKPRDAEELAEVGRRLKQLREAAGLSQTELCARTETPLPTLRNWEYGKREPGMLAIRRLAQALGVEPGELYKPFDPSLHTERPRSGRPRKGEASS